MGKDGVEATVADLARSVREVGEHVRAHAAVVERFDRVRAARPSDELLADAVTEIDVLYGELSGAERRLRQQMETLAAEKQRADDEAVKYRELFDAAPLAYVVTDRAGVIRDLNGAAVRLLGIEYHGAVACTLAALFDMPDVATFRFAMAQASAEAHRLELLLRRVGEHAPRVWVSLSCRASPDGERRLWMLEDVTAQRRVASELATGNIRLQRAVDERTAELSCALDAKAAALAREHEAVERVRAADRAKDRFIAVLAHDLRAPINAVLGWTSLLRRGALGAGEARDRALAVIERSARVQLRMIEDLLDVARIAEDRIVLEIGCVDLSLLARRASEAVQPLAAERRVSLEVDVRGRVLVTGDERRLGQILDNLLTNALKFSEPGGHVRLRVRGKQRRAVLEVRDDGRGIAADVLPHVFERFRQGNLAHAAHEGVGLGLYIVRRLVELHRGCIVATSDGPGRGATFMMMLPLTEGVAEQTPSATDLLVGGELVDVKVLVVEDDTEMGALIGAVLEQHGARVGLASTAARAQGVARVLAPDVLVSDIGLPDPDGCALLARLRAVSSITALAISAFATRDDENRIREGGFDDLLQKPFDPSDLVRKVRDLAGRKQG